jgi:prolyl oligopeptidase
MPTHPIYPATRREDVKDVLHGVEIADPYRWLENEKSDEVQAWMKAQDDVARAALAKLPEREALVARLKALYYVDVLYPPVHRGDRYFYGRRHADREKAVVYVKDGKDGAERILLDPNTWSADGSSSLGTWVPSWDGARVAYSVKANNSDEATLYVIDVATGKRSEVDVIEGAKYAEPSWTPKGDGFYYTYLPTDPAIPVAERPGYAEIRFHRLGDDPQRDRLVHEKTGDPQQFVNIELSRDGRFLLFTVQHGWNSTDVWFQDLKAKGAKWTALAVGRPFVYEVHAFGDRLYVRTNDGASKWRVMAADPKAPAIAKWKEVVPERADSTLDAVAIVGGKLALSYLKNAASTLELRGLDGKAIREVALPGIGTTSNLVGREDEDEAYYSFVSFTQPMQVFRTSVKDGGAELFSAVQVPVDPTPYTVEQVWYPSKDGTRVSMFLVHRKDLKRDGTNPTYLTGYGGFQVARTPFFDGGLYPWLERGGVFAMPNLRGGGEYGEAWHQDGMRKNKQHTFDDLIGAAEYLIREGYTRPEKLAIAGGSNGGLLVGAVMVQRPDLFKAVVCQVPLLDMLRYHRFGSGQTWISEYGSADDPEMFPVLQAYSPYHHVVPGTAYPALLMDSADADDRVDPMHARKFLAAIQAATTGGPAILRIERHSGHTGADMVGKLVERQADKFAFVMWQLGVGEGPAAGRPVPAPAPLPVVPAR